jgi:hypothetical protein
VDKPVAFEVCETNPLLWDAINQHAEAVSKSQDPVLVDYLMQFFHNIAAWIGRWGAVGGFPIFDE